jgi:hypothetical protein
MMEPMTEIESLAAVLASLAPLQIREMHHHAPALTVLGDGWSLSRMGAWTWRRNGAVVADGGNASASDELWSLCGLELLAVRFSNASRPGDCAFDLSDGGSLETRSDRTGEDTWVFRHDDLDRVFVAQ